MHCNATMTAKLCQRDAYVGETKNHVRDGNHAQFASNIDLTNKWIVYFDLDLDLQAIIS